MTIRDTITLAALACLTLSPLVAQAAPAAAEAATLRSIQGNADAARANAHIAQWKRVNIEVDRIAQDEHTLEAAGVADTALRAAVLALRSARQAHDGGMTERTAATVSALCASITR